MMTFKSVGQGSPHKLKLKARTFLHSLTRLRMVEARKLPAHVTTWAKGFSEAEAALAVG